jgi:peptidoglycan/xylan/chitin deacetylase (PgdA/CDA1 family)
MLQRGIITLVFDDGYASVKHNVVPALDRRGIAAVFAIPLSTTSPPQEAAPPTTAWPSWIELKKQGHEIAAHSLSHVDLTRLPDNELDRQLREPAQTLGATTLVYPGGAHNDRVVHAAHRYYRAARTVVRGFEKSTPAAPMRLKSFNFTRNNFSVMRANLLAVWAWLTNSWLIETYHEVSSDESDYQHTVPLRGFQKHLSFITALPIKIRTIENVMNDQ